MEGTMEAIVYEESYLHHEDYMGKERLAYFERKLLKMWRELIEETSSIKQEDEAQARIKTVEYGYCESTGEEIGLKRMEAQPLALLCIEAQEIQERREKEHKYSRYLQTR